MTVINIKPELLRLYDKWHHGAIALRDALLDVGAQLVYFDCVVREMVIH